MWVGTRILLVAYLHTVRQLSWRSAHQKQQKRFLHIFMSENFRSYRCRQPRVYVSVLRELLYKLFFIVIKQISASKTPWGSFTGIMTVGAINVHKRAAIPAQKTSAWCVSNRRSRENETKMEQDPFSLRSHPHIKVRCQVPLNISFLKTLVLYWQIIVVCYSQEKLLTVNSHITIMTP